MPRNWGGAARHHKHPLIIPSSTSTYVSIHFISYVTFLPGFCLLYTFTTTTFFYGLHFLPGFRKCVEAKRERERDGLLLRWRGRIFIFATKILLIHSSFLMMMTLAISWHGN